MKWQRYDLRAIWNRSKHGQPSHYNFHSSVPGGSARRLVLCKPYTSKFWETTRKSLCNPGLALLRCNWDKVKSNMRSRLLLMTMTPNYHFYDDDLFEMRSLATWPVLNKNTRKVC